MKEGKESALALLRSYKKEEKNSIKK